MSDPLASPPSRKGHQDLLHALILLGTVPLLFFAAFKLVEKTAEVPNKPPPPDVTKEAEQEIKKLNEKVNPVIVRPMPQKAPPPGEAWLREVAALEQRVATLRSTSNGGLGRIDQIRQQLATLRQHIEQHLDAVPKSIHDNHPLRAARLRIAEEIDHIVQTVPNQAASFDWNPDFATFEADERTEFAASVAMKVAELTNPLKEPHLAEITAITRETRDLRIQAQEFREKQFEIQRKTERELARQARLRAFEPDRAEVLRLLKPFISPDYMQLGRTTGDWVKSPESKPLSWSSIERLEALEPTQIGLDALVSIATQYGRDPKRRRPLGSFPIRDGSMISHRLEIESTKRAQQLLKKHGETLIEEGLLTP